MRIGWFDCGNTDNEYCGVDGGSNLRIPLLRELNQRGHTILAEMPDIGNYDYDETPLWDLDRKLPTHFVQQCYRFRDSIDFLSHVDLAAAMPSLDVLIVEARREDMDEFTRQVRLMSHADNWGIPVLVFDRNNWARQIPAQQKNSSWLLRPYWHSNDEWPERTQIMFLYFYRDDLPELELNPAYDLVYIGNRYGREAEMDEFLDGLEELDILICGNWTEKDIDLIDRYDFDFAGSTPHFAVFPLLKLGKATFHVGKPDYNDLGFLTLRPYEAKAARRPCFVSPDISGAENMLMSPWVTKSADDIMVKLSKMNFPPDSSSLNKNLRRTTTDAADQLEEVIEHVREYR